MTRSLRIAVLACFMVPALAGAASYIVPDDADLIRSADAIAIVTVQSSYSYFALNGRILTDYVVRVDETIKGLAGAETITVTQSGGVVGDIAMMTSGQPSFVAGERALLFLRRVGALQYTTESGELGKFSFVRDAEGRELLVRGATLGEIFGWDIAGKRHVERARDAAAFVTYMEAIVRGDSRESSYFANAVLPLDVVANSHVPGNDYVTAFTFNPTQGGRWQAGGLSMQGVGDQAAVPDDASAVQTAFAAWNNDGGSNISLTYAGGGASGPYAIDDGQDLILFDQPNSGPLAGSTVGQANIWAGSPHTFGGEQYYSIVDCDMIIEVGLSGSLFEAVVAHEVGHCLGFRHANQPNAGQTTTNGGGYALMNSSVSGTGAVLGDWDRDAASHVYGAGAPVCTAPSITFHPQSTTINSGSSANLSVSASGTSLTFQWFRGNSGDTSNPVAGATSASFNTGSLTSTTSFWVRVGQTCSSTTVNSNTATVTVQGTACTQPSFISHPQSATVTSGSSATLAVSVTGTDPISIQWFRGAAPSEANPVPGATGTVFNTGPLTATTQFWAKATNACGSRASNTATITVQAACTAPVITQEPQSSTVAPGGSALLSVSAGGTSLQYQWFRGATGNQSQPVPGATGPSFNTGPLQSTSQFWVRVFNSCGEDQSATATITVQAACTPPSIFDQPDSQTVPRNGSAFLGVAVA
ncbi:MAG: hypothetical protein ACRD2J_04705, partial [Thermoanaerobaculia bacterium]